MNYGVLSRRGLASHIAGSWISLAVPVVFSALLFWGLLFFVKHWAGVLTGGCLLFLGCSFVISYLRVPPRRESKVSECEESISLETFLATGVVSISSLADTLLHECRCIPKARRKDLEICPITVSFGMSWELASFMTDDVEAFPRLLKDDMEIVLEAALMGESRKNLEVSIHLNPEIEAVECLVSINSGHLKKLC